MTARGCDDLLGTVSPKLWTDLNRTVPLSQLCITAYQSWWSARKLLQIIGYSRFRSLVNPVTVLPAWPCIHQNSTWHDLNGQLLQNDNFPKIPWARGRPALCLDFLPAGISTKPKKRTVIWKRAKSIDSVLPASPSYIWQTAKGANPDNRQPGHYKRKLNC